MYDLKHTNIDQYRNKLQKWKTKSTYSPKNTVQKCSAQLLAWRSGADCDRLIGIGTGAVQYFSKPVQTILLS